MAENNPLVATNSLQLFLRVLDSTLSYYRAFLPLSGTKNKALSTLLNLISVLHAVVVLHPSVAAKETLRCLLICTRHLIRSLKALRGL